MTDTVQQLIRTKLLPPKLPPIVERQKLVEELENARHAKLITIVAGAGYGKSTLAAEFLMSHGAPAVWYQLEESDQDLTVFLVYLVAGLAGIHSGFGNKTLSQLAASENVGQQAKAILSTFITELDELMGEEMFIVLDDFQAVAGAPAINDALTFLLEHMLPSVHLVLCSRSALHLDLSHLRAKRGLMELSEQNLRFTLEETTSLFSEVFHMPLPEQELAALSESTEGWVSGLVLFYIALKGKRSATISEVVDKSQPSLAGAFEYLSKAAYENQPERVRDFARRACVLSRMSPPFCDRLLEIEDSRAVLDYMVSERLFTIPLDDKGQWYRFHHGLRAFLHSTLENENSPEQIRELHLRAARLWEETGEPEQALHHCMEAGEYEKAASLLEEMSEALIAAGRLTYLDRELSCLPVDILDMHPKLLQASAIAAQLSGDFRRTIEAAHSSGEVFGRGGQEEEKALSLVLLAAGMFQMGQFDEVEKTIAAAHAAIPPGSQIRYLLLAVEGQARLFQGNVSKAMRLTEEAMDHFPKPEDAGIAIPLAAYCGGSYFFNGMTSRAVEVYERAIEILEKIDQRAHAVSFYTYLTAAAAFADRYAEANEIAERSVLLAGELDLPTMTMLSHATRAYIRGRMAEHDGTIEDVSIAASMYEQSGVVALIAVAAWLLSEASAAVKERSATAEQLNTFREYSGNFEDILKFEKLVEVACHFKELGPQGVVGRVQEISETLGPHGMGLARSYALALRFRAQLAAGNHEEAVKVLSDYIAEFGQDIILRLGGCQEIEPVLAPFTELFAVGNHLAFMERVYGAGGEGSLPYLRTLAMGDDPEVSARAEAILATITREAAIPLRVCLLGHFEIAQGQRMLTRRDWRSRKALSVLKYLAARRGSGFVPRDALIDLLWPDVPTDSAAKSLNAALTTLRKTLEPEATRGGSTYLLARGEGLRLELGHGGSIDLEDFREKLASARKAREAGDFGLYFDALHEAAVLYRGDFLQEDLYEDWCMKERDALRGDCVGLHVDLATEHVRRGEDGEALDHLEKALAKDPGREDIYRKQMAVYSQMGDRAGMEETYRRCCRYLNDNYEVSPSAETTELYRSLRV